MKPFAVYAVLASLILGSAAQAAEPTPEYTFMTAANLVQRLRNDQKTICAQPRTNTSEKCRNDYEQAIKYEVVFTAHHVLYLAAYHGNAGAKELKRLKATSDKWLADVLRRTDVLDRDYLPVKTSDATQRK